MRGAIIIHGLTGTPATMAPLSEALGKAGLKILTPLLAGHGTSAEDLKKTQWKEWYKNVCSSYDILKNSCDEIFCVGMSLGSLLTLKLALDRSRPLKKISCLSLPLKLTPFLEKFLLPFSHLPPLRNIIKYAKKDWTSGVAEKEGRNIYQNASYSKIPVHSVWELQKLQRNIIKNLRDLKVPTLLIHSKNDRVAPPLNVDLFCRSVSRIKPEILWLERSEHVITLDMEKDLVVQKVSDYFK